MLAAFIPRAEANDMAVDKKAASPAAGVNPAEAPYPAERYAWYVVLVLMIVYIFSFIDRQIFGLLVDPIEKDLGINDKQIGLLMGPTFAIFYTLFGIPLGRLADSRSRRGLVTIGLFLWSLMSSACGMAKSYGQLLIFRVGVGVGEATLSPSAYSMIADYFRPKRMALAISVYGAGIYIGSGMASLLGARIAGWAAKHPAYDFAVIGAVKPWQLVFFAIGLPGIVFTLAMLTVREPVRRGLAKTSASGESIPFRVVLKYIRDNALTFFLHTVGFAFLSFIGYAAANWVPTLYTRLHGWSVLDIGTWYGIEVIIFGSSGIIFGGKLADWLAERGYRDAKIRAGFYGALLYAPFGALFPLIHDPIIAFCFLCPSSFAIGMPFGVAPAAIQEIMPNQMRGQAAAVYLFVVNLIGIGLGPYTVGKLTTDVFKDKNMLNYSLFSATMVAVVISIVFLYFCMGAFRKSLDYRDKWVADHVVK